ncbi:MAG: hypothetical protein D6696_15885 [Acidobacteria bacterium]|nr:MAG: hypothetical protein D6696_15885 [Acidobacteriota bacterium]
MDALAERVAGAGVGSFFVYTNEAHPGESFPHHTSMEQKMAHAAALRDELGVARPILVDALDGACHRAYGSMPNMTWILRRGGVVAYKADWTDAASVDSAIDYFLDADRRRKSGADLRPTRVERLEYRDRDRQAFLRGLERSGPKAVREYKQAFPG